MRSINLLPGLIRVLALLVALACASCAWASSGKLLYQFPYGSDGNYSVAPLVMDAAGNLYGTASYGGTYGAGIVFKLTPTGNGGWTDSVVYTFTGGQDGGGPQAGLILDSAGNLYGTTTCGGISGGTPWPCTLGFGTVFKLTSQSGGIWTESVLYSFTGGLDGGYPAVGLTFDSTGNLYGTTRYGGSVGGVCGTAGCGAVFELTAGPRGTWTENVLHAFTYSGNDGAYPIAQLVFDPSGNLYGTTSYGSSQNGYRGIVFELTPGPNHDWTENVLYALPGGGSQFQPGLVIDAAGNLYGIAQNGGSSGLGMVFQLSPGPGGVWNETTLYSFAGGSDGQYPSGSLVFDPAGNLYGATFEGGGTGCYGYGCGTIFELSANSGIWSETILYRLTGKRGCCSQAGLVRDAAGNLYGTASGGGGGNVGSVFELTPGPNGQWTGSLLHTFRTAQRGELPAGNLVSDAAGNLFGTTTGGGTRDYGTVFELDTTGKQTVLYSFAGGTDGESPYAGLALDAAGNLYGTTSYGGSVTACYSGCGTVFELSPNPGGGWKETVIHSFSDIDGNYPYAGVILDSAGNLYGTTSSGGPDRDGVVFELTPGQDGIWSESVLASFDSYGCGAGSPMGKLAFDGKGNLYGTTSYAGCSQGTVFELMPPQEGGSWGLSFLYSFCSKDFCRDGGDPQAGVILDSAGNVYGTTAYGGDLTCDCGVVFEIDTSRRETVLYAFTGGSDGANPYSDLAVGPGGTFYGTTLEGGGKGLCDYVGRFCGTVFELASSPGGVWREKVLHGFSGPDGGNPRAGVLLDLVGGHLYGTTPYGGIGGATNIGIGVVYELTR